MTNHPTSKDRAMKLPSWVKEVRPHQNEAVAEIIDHYRKGTDLVVLDAPTGSGKTLIAEMVRRELQVPHTSYICSSLTLQDQFANDFPEAAVVKGRTNYESYDGKHSAGDCKGIGCDYCPAVESCPYQMAKSRAATAPLACLNSTFQLYQSNYGNLFRSKGLLVWDECDELEKQLMSFVEVVISKKNAAAVGMTLPGKGVRYETVRRWLKNWRVKAMERHLPEGKEARSWKGLIRNVVQLLDDEGEWVRQSLHNALVMKPIKVDRFGEKLWTKGTKHLLMSATVISPSQLLADLGWTGSYGVVTVPMTFPVENRPLYVADTVDMAHKSKEENWPHMVTAVNDVLDRHPDENVLIHTVSYELTRFLYNEVATTKERHAYFSAAERGPALAKFRKSGGVLFAPSMDRGVDFSHDEARVIVLCKVPFPFLGDRQISTRLHSPGGQGWYTVQTIRTIVQMTGRGVRSASDHAVTYILDDQFRRVYGNNRRLFPPWWREALRYQVPQEEQQL